MIKVSALNDSNKQAFLNLIENDFKNANLKEIENNLNSFSSNEQLLVCLNEQNQAIGFAKTTEKVSAILKLDYIYVIPTCMPPHKEIDFSDSAEHRLRMCELAFKGVDGVVVSDMEIKRGGKSYTYDTLAELASEDKKLFFLCGTDMVLTFDTWYRFEDILKLCYPAYVRRENDKIIESRIIAKITEYDNKYGVMFSRILTDPIEVSSTDIRRMVNEGADISGIVPPAVADYIKENRLYV